MAGNTKTREYSWRDFIVREDPNFVRNSRWTLEYEFRRGSSHREFYAYYDKRGVYAPETVMPGGLMWGGIPINWNEQQLIWEEE